MPHLTFGRKTANRLNCNGDSSYFWGYTSNYSPQVVSATVATNFGNVVVNAYAPKW